MNDAVKKLRILFVEDNTDDAELAIQRLSNDGYQIEWQIVASELNLRRLLGEWTPDIILSDYSMPGFNGRMALQICQEIAPDIPFIFLSGTIGEELAIESMHQGATDYVLKENMRRLSSSVARALNDTFDRRRAREMEKERSRLTAILEATSDFVGIVGPDETIIYLNRGGRRMLGLEKDFKVLALEDIYPKPHLKLIRDFVHTNLRGSGPWQEDSMLLHKDGSEIPVSLVMIAHRNANKELEYHSFIARDVRDRHAFETRINYLAHYDPLTEMPNRALLAERVGQAITHSRWTNRYVAMLVIDIDRFKLVNDGYGHEFGDEVLRSFASRLRTVAGTRDTIARLNADCFAILASQLGSPEEVILLITKLQQELAQPFLIQDCNLTLTSGIGVSIFPRDGDDFTTLLRCADVAMHRLKESGKAGFQFYTTEMTQSASDRVRLETELHQALTLGQLELHYQIKVDLPGQRINGMEALMRWRHPERGMISPDIFIPIAENSELICSLGEWALFTACQQLKEWDKHSDGRLRMAVNVSVRQFRSVGFTELVEHTLKTLQLEPERLELEITESVLVHDQQEAAGILFRLSALGVQISLDDFGTGYSNLSYLSRLPIHCLKIDKSFVLRSSMDKNDMEIVRAVISLAYSLGLRVVAEGIETQEQLETLLQYQCGEGQGYYFSRPLPNDKILPLLLKQADSQSIHPGKGLLS